MRRAHVRTPGDRAIAFCRGAASALARRPDSRVQLRRTPLTLHKAAAVARVQASQAPFTQPLRTRYAAHLLSLCPRADARARGRRSFEVEPEAGSSLRKLAPALRVAGVWCNARRPGSKQEAVASGVVGAVLPMPAQHSGLARQRRRRRRRGRSDAGRRSTKSSWLFPVPVAESPSSHVCSMARSAAANGRGEQRRRVLSRA